MSRVARWAFVALWTVLPALAAAQAKQVNYAYRYRLLGVYDEQSGDPIEGVEVIDVLNGNKASTTKTGTVSLMFLPEGASLVRLRKIGYEVLTLTVAISPADTNPVTVVLSRATQLPAVVVKDSAPTHYISPGLRAFEERRKVGIGHFISEAELRKNEGHTLGDVIVTHIPGVTTVFGVAQKRPSSKFLVSTRKMCAGNVMTLCKQPNCFVTVYEDGVRIYDAANSDPSMIPDMEHMNSRQYAAIEFYNAGEAPAEYTGTGGGCGVLLLWSRER
jgi:hypothetical protein